MTPDMRDRIVLITGSTDGLGKQVAHNVAERGAILLLHGCTPEKGAAVRQEIHGATGNQTLEYYNADFASLDAVRGLAEEITAAHGRLDILINNAGIGVGARTETQRKESEDGYERRFAVNYLAHFLLTHRLVSLLSQSAPARIVNVASVGQQPINFDDVMLEEGYDGWRAYRQSKLALVMFTFNLAEKLRDSDITVNSLHPASLMNTNMVYEYFGGFEHAVKTVSEFVGRFVSTVEEGADAVEYLATSPSIDGVTGEYFEGKQRARAHAQAYDEDARQQLRQISQHLTEAA